MSRNISACHSSQSDIWNTPEPLYGGLDLEFRFGLDPASDGINAKCKKFFTPVEDGLKQSWQGYGAVFLNPPYSDITAWLAKAFEECQKGATVAALVPSRTGARWWWDYAMRATEIRYLKGRLKFSNAKNSAPFDSAILVYRPPRIGGPV